MFYLEKRKIDSPVCRLFEFMASTLIIHFDDSILIFTGGLHVIAAALQVLNVLYAPLRHYEVNAL